MPQSSRRPTRIHLISPANPASADIRRFGFAGVDSYLRAIRDALPAPYRLTVQPRLLEAVEDQRRGGRRDDALRVRDIQDAISDPDTIAIVSSNGGAYLTRILPHLDFSPLSRREAPLWACGFSELTNFVNIVASFPSGRGLYWLCPNYLAWKVRPAAAAREQFTEFWRELPGAWSPGGEARFALLARRRSGRLPADRTRIIGGCLSVLAANLCGPLARRLRPQGALLAIEDVNEAPYRVDRHLAALKLAGWFERLAGVIVGDFHTGDEQQSEAVLNLLPFHIPRARRGDFAILTSPQIGHVWPMAPLLLNRACRAHARGRRIELVPTGRAR